MQKLLDMTPPANLQQLQSFLGLANYFRHFMDSYAEVSKPLHTLVTETNKLDTRCRLAEWTEQHHRAFEATKELLMHRPVIRSVLSLHRRLHRSH